MKSFYGLKISSTFRIFDFSGWIGFSDQQMNEAADKYLNLGFKAFKVKVGKNLYEDVKRLEKIRALVGWDKTLVKKYFPQ